MGDDNDLIRRGDIFSAVNKAMWQNIDIRDAIAALPAAPAEDVRAGALKEAAVVAYRICAETRHMTLAQKAEAAIVALIPEAKP